MKLSFYVQSFMILSSILFVTSNNEVKQLDSDDGPPTVKRRAKRYLEFPKTTKILFRINVKDNVLIVNQLFAHAFGFRANIEMLVPDKKKHHKIKRRQVYDTLEELINQHGFDGRACILKTFCDASNEVTPQSGMLFKLFKMIFTHRPAFDVLTNNSLPNDDGQRYPYLNNNDCDELGKHCPLSLMELTPYTDV